MPVRTALYRHFDDEGRLLYVGISLQAMSRLAQHKQGSDWFGKICNVEIEWFASREKAMLAEARAIKKEKPLCNITHNSLVSAAEQSATETEDPDANADWRSCVFVNLEQASKVLGLSRASLYALEKAGVISFVRLGGRVLVRTTDILGLAKSAEPWTASARGQEAREARRKNNEAAWSD